MKVYAGTKEPIKGAMYEADGNGIYFSTNRSVAESYNWGGGVYEFDVELGNALIIDCQGSTWQDIPVPDELWNWLQGVEATTWNVARYAKQFGYDGVILKNIQDIGCAKPSTYDGKESDTVILFDGGTIELLRKCKE